MADQKPAEFDDLLREDRTFPPPPAFRAQRARPRRAHLRRGRARSRSVLGAASPASSSGRARGTRVLDWQPPHAKWFVGGQAQRQRQLPRPPRARRRAATRPRSSGKASPAIGARSPTSTCYREVSTFANVLKSLGVDEGRPRRDLHAARSRAGHRDARLRAHRRRAQRRLRRLQRRVAARSHQRRAGAAAHHRRRRLPPRPDRAAQDRSPTRRSPTRRRSSTSSSSSAAARPIAGARCKEGRDHWYHELMQDAPLDVRCPSRWTPRTCSTSSTRPARPGSRRASSTPPAAIWSAPTRRRSWSSTCSDDDVYWCTADIGWVTGHSYVVYGPLANGATVLMYEGAPDWPQKDRFWSIIERYGVTIFYTAPTAIRAFMRWGTEWPAQHDLSSLRLLGSVGEPINPEAWIWYHQLIGGERCPVVDTWWQTETGAIMITPLPGRHDAEARLGDAAVPRHRGGDPQRARRDGRGRRRPAGAHAAVAVDAARHLRRSRALRAASTGTSGAPASTSPATAPSATPTATSGCSAAWTTCINVAGHRIGTMEVESALVDHPERRRSGRRRPRARDQGAGDRRVRHAQGRRRTARPRISSTSSRSTS